MIDDIQNVEQETEIQNPIDTPEVIPSEPGFIPVPEEHTEDGGIEEPVSLPENRNDMPAEAVNGPEILSTDEEIPLQGEYKTHEGAVIRDHYRIQ